MSTNHCNLFMQHVLALLDLLFVCSNIFTSGLLFAENMSESPCETIPPINEVLSKTIKLENGCDSMGLRKKAVVVLTRLPEGKISALRPPTPQQFYSEDESLSSSDSDMQWEPEGDSSGSDCPQLNNKHSAEKKPVSEAPGPSAPSTSSNSNGKATNGHHDVKISVKKQLHNNVQIFVFLSDRSSPCNSIVSFCPFLP